MRVALPIGVIAAIITIVQATDAAT